MNHKLLKLIIAFALLFMIVETGFTAKLQKHPATIPAIIKISAKNISINQKTSSMVYTGNVRLSHKTLLMTGARAVASNRKSNAKHITLTGNPGTASFTDKNGQSTQLRSNKLTYNSHSRIVIATGNASIKTRSGTLFAHKIKYNLSTDQFSVEGNHKSPRISARFKAGDFEPGKKP